MLHNLNTLQAFNNRLMADMVDFDYHKMLDTNTNYIILAKKAVQTSIRSKKNIIAEFKNGKNKRMERLLFLLLYIIYSITLKLIQVNTF